MIEQYEVEEVGLEEGVRQLNECEYLFVRELREIEELSLRLIVTEAKVQARTATPPIGFPEESLFLFSGAKPIEEDAICRVFELLFERRHLVLYTVLNESFGKYPQSPEIFTGKLFRIFSWSHLLDFTRRTTYASDANPGPLLHYELAALNHVVDVIATAPPRIAAGILQSMD